MGKKQDNSGEKIWDEIFKRIVQEMPDQLLPLIEDVFGVKYPRGIQITKLATEHVIPAMNPKHLTSIYSDVAVKIGEDIYHFEFQMTNERNMTIRMFKYDINIAFANSIVEFKDGSASIDFPKSVVIYPAVNEKIPDELICNINFPDGTSHEYRIPTVKIQSYDLKTIREKHLTFFLPFLLLRFRPRLSSKKNPLSESELTEFLNEIKLFLGDEMADGRITKDELLDYASLVEKSASRIFKNKSNFRNQVVTMTDSLIKLPSVEYKKEIAELKASLEESFANMENIKTELKSKDSELKSKDSELKSKDSELKSKDLELKSKDDEIIRLKQKLKEAGIED